MSIYLATLCNTDTLVELLQVLQPMSDATYRQKSPALSETTASSIGAHCRHILEFYQCFFQGLPTATIDYDSRLRNPQIEQNKIIAIAQLHAICHRLEQLPTRSSPEKLTLKTQVDSKLTVVTSSTCVMRELLFLQSHSVHHLAIIALLMTHYGQVVPFGFGLANSTRSTPKKFEIEKATS